MFTGSLVAAIVIVAQLRKAQYRVVWVITGWTVATVLVPVAGLILLDVFALTRNVALIVSTVIGLILAMFPIVYIMLVTSRN